MTDTWAEQAERRGYMEALLDVYCYLTGDGQILDYPERLALVEKMVQDVNKRPNKLQEVE